MAPSIYPSKILLFGEYTVLHGGMAYAIPNMELIGKWEDSGSNEEQETIFNAFKDYANTIKECSIDIHSMQRDFDNGLRYQSNIPIGYGIGSSGAFTAAIYDRYVLKKTTDLNILKKELASIESFFHGQSSGIDPLVSFTKKAIFKDKQGQVHAIEPSDHKLLEKVELIDSGISRSSEEYIELYKEKLKDSKFTEAITQLTLLQDEIISKLNTPSKKLYYRNTINQISQLQYDNFQEMIPDALKSKWKSGLTNGDYAIKLCGAGGGGYFLKFNFD